MGQVHFRDVDSFNEPAYERFQERPGLMLNHYHGTYRERDGLPSSSHRRMRGWEQAMVDVVSAEPDGFHFSKLHCGQPVPEMPSALDLIFGFEKLTAAHVLNRQWLANAGHILRLVNLKQQRDRRWQLSLSCTCLV
jgi:hypothetical protein